MLRILSSAAPRAVARAAFAAPRAAVALRVAAQQCACIHTTAAVRAPKEAEVVEEGEGEEQERELVPLPEARTRLVAAMAKEAESFDVSEDFAQSYAQDRALNVKIDLSSESVVATRETEGHKIQITFRAEALENQEEMPEEEGQQQQEGEEENKLPEHRFNVDVTSPNGKVMRLECFNSDKGELEIGNITFPSTVSADPATAARPTEAEEAEVARTGLRVEELSEEASQSLFDYLEALGVDDDLAVFVSSQAQQVRTQAMIARINNLKSFAQ